MLGSRIGPIVWTLVIRQVARQPLPRVIPEKTFTGSPTILLLRYTRDWPRFAICSHRLVVLALDS